MSLTKGVFGVLIALVCQLVLVSPVRGQTNTDANLRYYIQPFILEVGPSSAISCNSLIADAVRTIIEDCLDLEDATVCVNEFPQNPPDGVILGDAQCLNDSEILFSGGTMDFPIPDGLNQSLVNQCVNRILSQGTCLPSLQSTFPLVSTVQYSVDTPAPTFVPTPSPSSAMPSSNSPTPSPSASPSVTPPTELSGTVTEVPTAQPSLRAVTSTPLPTRPSNEGAIVENDSVQRGSAQNNGILGLYIGAGVFCFGLLLFVLVFAARRRRKVEEEVQAMNDSTDVCSPPNKDGIGNHESLNLPPPVPPPGILYHNSPRAAPQMQSDQFYSLPDDYSAQGTEVVSVGEADLTMISSVDLNSLDDGSESFVDQTRTLNQAISKDMLGGSSEVPKNRNPLFSRLGASLTPHLVRSSSSSDDGDSQPRRSSRKSGDGFHNLDDDSSDEEFFLDAELAEPRRSKQPEEFREDPSWDPDDAEEEGENGKIFSKRKARHDTSEGSAQLPMPPELTDSSRRKPRPSTPRGVLGGGRRMSPSTGHSI